MTGNVGRLRILHTSDWHLGMNLCGRKRLDEAEAFTGWLVELLERERINVVIIAGDIFDSVMPGNGAQEIYYRFLAEASALPCCRHIIIIGGNHDSPSLLEAPSALLKRLNVHVSSGTERGVDGEILELCGADGKPELLLGAVPYLRDRELRSSAEGEGFDCKERNLLNGLLAHYAGAGAELVKRLDGRDIPVVVTGHLFASGAVGGDDEGMRELYVGGLALFPADGFPGCADYVALGHLHMAQKVGGRDNICY